MIIEPPSGTLLDLSWEFLLEAADDGADGHDQLEQAGLKDLGDLIQVAGDPAEDLTRQIPVKKPYFSDYF